VTNIIQRPYFMMGLHLEKFNPFICEMRDLENEDLSDMKKR
jgi:hypothetical protein